MTPHQRLTLTRFALAVLNELDGRPAAHRLGAYTLAHLTPGVATLIRQRQADGRPGDRLTVRVRKPYRRLKGDDGA